MGNCTKGMESPRQLEPTVSKTDSVVHSRNSLRESINGKLIVTEEENISSLEGKISEGKVKIEAVKSGMEGLSTRKEKKEASDTIKR